MVQAAGSKKADDTTRVLASLFLILMEPMMPTFIGGQSSTEQDRGTQERRHHPNDGMLTNGRVVLQTNCN